MRPILLAGAIKRERRGRGRSMKKLVVLCVSLVAALSVAASVAVADPGNGVATVQFTASFDCCPGHPPIHFTCKGERIVTVGPNASVRDRETCTASNLVFPEGTFSAAGGNWFSDYDGAEATSGEVTVKNNPDGTQTWQIHVGY
jgi:hypothetical protein